MFDNTQPMEIGWYDWDCRLAVVADRHAFVLNEKRGWGKVNPADVTWDGKPFASSGEAIECYSDLWHGIDATVVAAHAVRGIAPPRPRRYRSYHLIEACISLQEPCSLSGDILVEFDDGWMRRINGKELALLANRYKGLKTWRLSGRDIY